MRIENLTKDEVVLRFGKRENKSVGSKHLRTWNTDWDRVYLDRYEFAKIAVEFLGRA